MFKSCFAFIASIAPFALISANPLNPGTPSPIVTDNSLTSSTVVAGSDSAFVAAWIETSNQLFTASSTWTLLAHPIMEAFGNPRICSGSLGFVLGWPNIAIPGVGANPAVSFSSDNGASWSTPDVLTDDLVGGINVSVASNEDGFMVTYTSLASHNGFSSFSNDGTTWGSLVQINAVDGSLSTGFSTTVAGMGHVYLAAWVDSDLNAQTSVSTNDGASWRTPAVPLTSDMTVNSEVTLSANSAGFIAGWVTLSGDAISRFSTDGINWGPPVTIATGVNTGNSDLVGLSGSAEGIVAAWQDSGNVANASFSGDNGSTWSPQVEIAPDLFSTFNSIVGVSLVDGECLFTWTDNVENNFSSSSSISSSASRAFRRPNNGR